MKTRWIGGIIALLVCSVAIIAEGKKLQPNVVLIMADDLGYHDLGCYGHPAIKTPVLDELAQSGVRLTSFYSGATVCTPSRMALLTGAYPPRLGWRKGVVGYMIPTNQGLSPKALTMAEVFKESGYATGIFGKWHLGDWPSFRPHRQGFDKTYYVNKSNNQTTKIWMHDDVVEDPFDNRLLTEKFTHQAKAFIQENKENPFFLYLPYTAPHFPVEAHPDFKGASEFGVYGDVVEELDFRIGELLKILKQSNLLEKTIVIFLSDNGPQPGEQAQAKPFRGMKWDALEGGTRVPCIVSWPGVIPASSVRDELIAAIDWLPTLASACGVNLQNLSRGFPKIDGMNIIETLTAKALGPHPRKNLLYWHGAQGFHAIRVGKWKLFPNANDANLLDKNKGVALFDLSNDPEERNNVSHQHPERVQMMQALAIKQLNDISGNSIPLAAE